MVVKINHPKRFFQIEIDNKLCSLTANSQANLIYTLNVKFIDIFCHHYTLNPVKIYTNIVDTMTILLVDSQKLLLANIVLKILLEILFQSLITYYTIFKTNKVIVSSNNYFWSRTNIDLV